ncbi:hypothetical protein MHM95_09365 [Pseudoalteromonas sp. CnMc7-15]|uniref:PssE/Cps14G family polysaccharide biosynthesis glycosyltransferase n=1 Tax=unclassified Pseudoalteromonas TaxID=194690 RepID=UPI001EF6B88E|nr:PssE/Cps14G family polysaccharide biosynthesis glycosyltransferase [Pseudoalteromonas sp. CnMc7-15]MCG7566498.1 hypothetical protein [Pseudoalteromonas sp. CnMc7-15]
MKVLVTVGNTRFDSLFKQLDSIAQLNTAQDITFLGQISNGVYKPKNFSFFKFSTHIQQYIDESEFVICHAGAGSVYSMLEQGKTLLVVYNTDRVDSHQKDLLHFLQDNKYALVCWRIEDLESQVSKLKDFEPTPYKKPSFSAGREISEYLLG